MRLFCFHPAGKGASVFAPWIEALPEDVELACIQLPGRENRFLEQPVSSLPLIIERLEESIFPLLDRPFGFFGASMGALIAFELAHQIRDVYGVQPLHFTAASSRAPQLPARLPPLRHLPDQEFIDALQERYQGIPEEILQEKDFVRLILPLLRADFTIVESYQYRHRQPLDCPITAWGGLEDAAVLPDELAGWQAQTTAGFTQHRFSGGHFFFTAETSALLQRIGAQTVYGQGNT